MSFSSSRKKALDDTQPINFRVSSARSCAVCVSEKFKVKRSEIIDEVFKISGVDLNSTTDSNEIKLAISILEEIRFNGIQ